MPVDFKTIYYMANYSRLACLPFYFCEKKGTQVYSAPTGQQAFSFLSCGVNNTLYITRCQLASFETEIN